MDKNGKCPKCAYEWIKRVDHPTVCPKCKFYLGKAKIDKPIIKEAEDNLAPPEVL